MVNIADKRFSPTVTRYESPLGRMLTVIECPHTQLRYLILDCPTESTLGFYLDEFKHLCVHTVVRCCQPTYQAQRLLDQGIQVLDLPFKDGGLPPAQVIQEWLQLVEKIRGIQVDDDKQQQSPMIAVHCVAGLGRAPVLVAIALIEMGMKPLDAIEYIRSKRRGAFNKPQIMFLDSYKRILKPKSSSSNYSLRSSLGRMFKLGGSTNGKANSTSSSTTDQH
ncbi:protein-tyrosine phosphatase-like protein [Halteromyces radiatus]|uniref:protein-tyrosine phosphatase-like protein n=1 Tax=Halteromyces radiatus TaxID=101107 RepID=UPI0022206B2A|nr:protein-tyrosine phosphatase-like protein [Halteromyces radiatus]KAI8089994.1 protein-tyrosine phosphatase-like protein [Halteromyces radiatus]